MVTGANTLETHHETVVWAYGDMDAARRLWPRVKQAIEDQCARDRIRLDLGAQRRVIAAAVNDLLNQKKPAKRNWCAPKTIGKLLHLFRNPDAQAPSRTRLPV